MQQHPVLDAKILGCGPQLSQRDPALKNTAKARSEEKIWTDLSDWSNGKTCKNMRKHAKTIKNQKQKSEKKKQKEIHAISVGKNDGFFACSTFGPRQRHSRPCCNKLAKPTGLGHVKHHFPSKTLGSKQHSWPPHRVPCQWLGPRPGSSRLFART